MSTQEQITYLKTGGVALIAAGVAMAVTIAAMGGGAEQVHTRGLLFVYPMITIGLVLVVWSRVEGALGSMLEVERSIKDVARHLEIVEETVGEVRADLDTYLAGDDAKDREAAP